MDNSMDIEVCVCVCVCVMMAAGEEWNAQFLLALQFQQIGGCNFFQIANTHVILVS